jgi:hypothetical protein
MTCLHLRIKVVFETQGLDNHLNSYCDSYNLVKISELN